MTAKHLSLILAAGEGYRIEFKEQMANLDKEMVAFANASGGFIYLGINDDRVVQGIEITNKLKSQIQDIARNCDPPVQILLDAYKNILIIEVREGMDKPYRCSTGFYNRTGPNAQKMKRDEIIEFVKSEGKIRFDEMVNRNFPVAEFDDAKFDKFLKLAGISKVMETEEILQNLHAAEVQLGTCYYYNTAVLFFAKNLDKHFFHTCVTCALYKGLDKVTILDRKDFNHDIIDNIDKAMIFLQQHLNVRYEFDGSPARKEIPEIPIEALREAVINAVIHRDYFEKGANAMVEIYDDRVEITNPGGLPKGLKEKDFGKISILRNPNIANLMQRIEYIEKMGTGIRRMQKMLAGAGLPPIKYEFSSFVRAVFFRPREERVNFEVKDREADYYASTPQVPRKYPASTPQVPRKQKPGGAASILAFCAVPRSRAEIQTYLGLKDREHFRLDILQPLLKDGSLIPTIPDKPNSPRQKYLAVKKKW